MKKNNSMEKLNNKGTTLVELTVSFALLALFMVAATRIISYTVTIYHSAKAATYGMEVSNMISNKVVGQIEGAKDSTPVVVTSGAGGIDTISFMDETGSKVSISAAPQTMPGGGSTPGNYMCIYYDEVTDGSVKYDAVEWRFDSEAYMGYTVSELDFEYPGTEYGKNVLRMNLSLHSEKYGEYETAYYIKCVDVDEIEYK